MSLPFVKIELVNKFVVEVDDENEGDDVAHKERSEIFQIFSASFVLACSL